jgi:glutamate dehydrogenase/leucine dehydrogenase
MPLDAMQNHDYEQIVFLQNQKIGMRAIVCIHDTRHGPAHGGIRRLPYRSEAEALADVLQLAHAMSRKAAIAGIRSGGGKAVIIDHPGLNRRAAYEMLGQFIESWQGRFFTGPDVGTTERDLAAVRRKTRFVVPPQTKDGPGHIAGATARGVIVAIRSTLRHLFNSDSPRGKRFAVQGLGAIGERVADWLWESGAELIVTDVDRAKIDRWRGRERVRVVAPAKIVAVECDLFSPNALGGFLDARTPLHCRAIVGAANNPLADEHAAHTLHKRGILFAPDFLVNAGGLIEGASRNLGFAEKSDALITRIGHTLTTIYRRSERENRPPYMVALDIADNRLKPGKTPARMTMRID